MSRSNGVSSRAPLSQGFDMDLRVFHNQLLQSLPDSDLQKFSRYVDRVTLKAGYPLERAGKAIEYVYFPDTALISKVASTEQGGLEIAMFGEDGMSGTALIIEAKSPFDCVVSIAGSGSRIAAAPFLEFIRTRPGVSRTVLRYAQAEQIQMGFTALAAGRIKMEARIARWILMAHDRIGGNVIKVTQGSLADLLGVQRPGVSNCLSHLEAIQLIKSRRGEIRVLDRPGLIALAGTTYGAAERTYQNLLGFPLGSQA